jgi:hypothetical protein
MGIKLLDNKLNEKGRIMNNKIQVISILIFGFTGIFCLGLTCDDHSFAAYGLHGTIKDSLTLTGIPNVRVTLSTDYKLSFSSSSVYTDSMGSFKVTGYCYLGDDSKNQHIHVICSVAHYFPLDTVINGQSLSYADDPKTGIAQFYLPDLYLKADTTH